MTRTGLTLRILADRSAGERVKKYDPDTGESYLFNPATGQAEGWPSLGLKFEGDVPQQVRVPTSTVQALKERGFLSVENERPVHRPGGQPENLWRPDKVHTFLHVDSFTLHTVDGDYTYNVVGQPDKYAHNATYDERGFQVEPGTHDDETKVTPEIYNAGETEVRYYYDADLVSDNG